MTADHRSAQPQFLDRSPLADYQDLGVIGRGKFSEVHKARHIDGRIVAIKKVAIFDMDSAARKEFVNETELMQSLPPHPNIVRYHCSFIEGNDLYSVFELAASGDLQQRLDAARMAEMRLDEATVWKYFVQIADALQTMHQHRIMHRDLKPSNCFLDGMTVKLGDLGLGRYMSSKTYEAFSQVGTNLYLSPEVVSAATGYDFKADIWSLGCLLYELWTLRSPFIAPNMNYYTLGLAIRSANYQPIPDYVPETARTLIQTMLQVDPGARPSAARVFEIAQNTLRGFADK